MRTTVLAALLVAIASVGCQGAPAAPAAAPAAPSRATSAPAAAAPAANAPDAPVAAAPTAPRPLTRVVQALPSRDFGYLPTTVALSKGFFAEEGLADEQPVMVSSAAIPALTNREIQLATAGSAVRAAYQGAPLKGIFYQFNKTTFIAVGTSEVRSYRDLPGKLIAVSSPGSSEDLAAKMILRREGIPLTDVQVLPMGQGPQRTQAMLAGLAQFSVLNPDLAVEVERQGGTILGNLRDLMPVPWAGFAMHQDTLRDQPELAKAWLRASIRGIRFMQQNQAETVEIAVHDLQVDPALARPALDLVLPSLGEDDPGGWSEAGITLLAQLDLESLDQTGDAAELARRVNDVTYLRQAQRELGITCRQGAQC
jgi:ABC-type nitrate/sulfonate/bicarbonate transport system substrate-binding protein